MTAAARVTEAVTVCNRGFDRSTTCAVDQQAERAQRLAAELQQLQAAEQAAQEQLGGQQQQEQLKQQQLQQARRELRLCNALCKAL